MTQVESINGNLKNGNELQNLLNTNNTYGLNNQFKVNY